MRLKVVRTLKGQTQAEVALILGATRKQVYQWEHAKVVPNSYTRKKLAAWANTPQNILFKGLEESK
jgi:transcriptional regulator with XRE-family HTH domain